MSPSRMSESRTVTVALETSARPPSVAVARDESMESLVLSEGRRHASDLLPGLERLLEEIGAGPDDIGLIAVGLGPGSYTGLRVGIATALGLARGTGAPVVGVPSVAALAYAVLAPGEEATVLLDARSRELYVARYRRADEGVVELEAPRVTPVGELAGSLPAEGRILGDATVAEAAALDAPTRARLTTDRVPDARAVLALGRRRFAREGATPAAELEPLYLRPFAAR